MPDPRAPPTGGRWGIGGRISRLAVVAVAAGFVLIGLGLALRDLPGWHTVGPVLILLGLLCFLVAAAIGLVLFVRNVWSATGRRG